MAVVEQPRLTTDHRRLTEDVVADDVGELDAVGIVFFENLSIAGVLGAVYQQGRSLSKSMVRGRWRERGGPTLSPNMLGT